MKQIPYATVLSAALALGLTKPDVARAVDLVTSEAESADVLGASFITGNDGGVIYISSTDNHTSQTAPMLASRVASYSVTFLEPGNYELYARVRVGAGGFNDDSMFYATSFGSKSPTLQSDWVFVNGLAGVGYTADTDIVGGAGGAGNLVWKWINLSLYAAGGSFIVTPGNLTQTFQIGGREDGFDIDKLVFGTSGTAFTVASLDSGMPPAPPTNAFPGPDGIALHRFSPFSSGINADGANPSTGLALLNGVLCGTTLSGGLSGAGTAYYLSANGSNFAAFRAFANAPDAGNPEGELSVSGNGFFGTSFGGGSAGVGAVFVGQTNGTVSVIRNFAGVSADNATNSGGASPSSLIALASGTLYGTTTAGGVNANGTVFALTTNGTTFVVLHDFSLLHAQAGTNADGATPWGGLILSGDTLYGTASAGGAGGSGVVFSVNTNGANFTTLHSFEALDPMTATNVDGAIPYGGLVLSNDVLFGTTAAGGSGGSGTIFSLQTDGSGFTVLYHFTATSAVTGTNLDGASPGAGLILSDNVLYGTASAGGAGAAGTVFALNLGNTQFTTLHGFAAVANNGTNSYGAFPVTPVLRLGDSLYGTAFGGGPGAAGTVFGIPLAAQAAVITDIIRNAGGVDLYFLGGPDSTNVIQAAGSLEPPVVWQNVSTNVADANGEWQYSESVNSTNRFYRSYAP